MHRLRFFIQVRIPGPKRILRMHMAAPGGEEQQRFNFMWAILKKRAKGMILLVNSDAPDPIAEMIFFLDEFRELYDRGGVVIGITRADVVAGPSLDDFALALERTNPGLLIPVFTVDPRDRDQMVNVLLALIANIEMRAMFGMITEAETA